MTLDDIKARCTECGDCWEWQGALNKSGSPQMQVKRKRTLVRRFLVEQKRGQKLPYKMLALTDCGNPRCVNPDHIVVKTRQNNHVTKHQASTRVGVLKMTRTKRQKSSLDWERIGEIRESPLSHTDLARQLGVNRTTISAIRRNRIWKPSLSPNPFQGLM